MMRLLSESAADYFRQQIADGVLPPGARLPSERQLSADLGISRTALRDALAILASSGYVEVRPGRGRFVTDTSSGGANAAQAWLAVHRADLQSLNEVRALLEPYAVQTTRGSDLPAVSRAAREILERQLAAISNSNLQEAAHLDGEFHHVLISGSPNVPLRELTEQLISAARVHASRLYGVPGVASHSVAEHEDILNALSRGDVDLAAELLRNHTNTAYKRAFG